MEKYEEPCMEIIELDNTPLTLKSAGQGYPEIMSSEEDPTFN